MSLEQTEAIVLRIYPWSETSCIANIFTRDFGKLSVLAKGARRPKSPFEAALDLLSICRVVFIAKSTDALDILTEAKLQRRYRAGSHSLLRLYCGYYVAELLDRLTDKGDQQPEIFELAIETLDALNQIQLEPRAIVLRFELQMLRMVGNLPSWQQCVQCGKDVRQDKGITFSALSGGALCHDCRPGARWTIRVPAAAQDVLQRFSNAQWQDIDVTGYPTEQRTILRRTVCETLTTLLDRKLQLHSYLEELGR